MKRALCIVLILTLIALVGCTNNDSQQKTTDSLAATDYAEKTEFVTEAEPDTEAETVETAQLTAETAEIDGEYTAQTDLPFDWNTHTFNYTDDDGYQFEITIKASPWILTTNTDILNSAWSIVGKGNPLPEFFSDWGLKKVDNYQNRDSVGTYPYDRNFLEEMTDMYYSVGQVSVKNNTEGWSISESNPRALKFLANTSLGLSGNSMAKILTRIFFGNGTKDEGNELLLNLNLTSDNWGPVSYIMMAPENFSPKYPDGKNYEKTKESYLVSGGEVLYLGVIGKDGVYQIVDTE